MMGYIRSRIPTSRDDPRYFSKHLTYFENIISYVPGFNSLYACFVHGELPAQNLRDLLGTAGLLSTLVLGIIVALPTSISRDELEEASAHLVSCFDNWEHNGDDPGSYRREFLRLAAWASILCGFSIIGVVGALHTLDGVNCETGNEKRDEYRYKKVYMFLRPVIFAISVTVFGSVGFTTRAFYIMLLFKTGECPSDMLGLNNELRLLFYSVPGLSFNAIGLWLSYCSFVCMHDPKCSDDLTIQVQKTNDESSDVGADTATDANAAASIYADTYVGSSASTAASIDANSIA
jgi:hypothetical protein